MAKPQSTSNPFYLLLLLAGLAFSVTACAYGVMVVQSMKPLPLSSPLLEWLQKWGTQTLAAEIGVLALLTFAAFATDSYWTKQKNEVSAPSDD